MKDIGNIDFNALECADSKGSRFPANKIYLPENKAYMQLQLDAKNMDAITASIGMDRLDVRADFINDRLFIRAGGHCRISRVADAHKNPYIQISALKDSAIEAYGKFRYIPVSCEIVRAGNELVALIELQAKARW